MRTGTSLLIVALRRAVVLLLSHALNLRVSTISLEARTTNREAGTSHPSESSRTCIVAVTTKDDVELDATCCTH